MKRTSVVFKDKGKISVIKGDLPQGASGHVLVEASLSAISAGSELLFYRGELESDTVADLTLPALGNTLAYPLKYGYQSVGRIIDTSGGDDELIGKRVFAFQPHHSHFWADPADLILLPADLPMEDAVFLPNMETAVNLLQDGRPILGEQVIVLGQGVVGLLTTSLLSRMALASLITVDSISQRRAVSMEMGASASLAPEPHQAIMDVLSQGRNDGGSDGVDLLIEVTGNPESLALAVKLAGFDSRIIIGSWYGTKRAALALGSSFHRNRIQIKSSQVSTLNPSLTGRWTKQRRLDIALQQLSQVEPSRLITHRFSPEQAPEAYRLLDSSPGEAIQVIFDYLN